MDITVNYRARRAIEARFNHRYGKILSIISLLLALLAIALGIFLLLTGQSVGWVLIGFSSWPLMLFSWIKLYLRHLPATKKLTTINDLLAGDVLALLPSELNPRVVLSALAKTNGAYFFATRFGISIEMLIEVTPNDTKLMPTVWEESLNIWAHITDRPNTISSAIVIAALIRLNPAADDMLDNLRIDRDDIFAGAVWYEYLNGLANINQEPRLTGGIARDWSFGYIPTLEHFGVNLSAKYNKGGRSLTSNLASAVEAVDQTINLLGESTRRNVALIGPFGAGKTTIVESFAEAIMDSRAKIPSSIKFNQVFMLDASAIISAAHGRGDIEQLVNRLFIEAYKAKNIILFLDNAELFFVDGTGSVDLVNLLQPIIEGGSVKLILAMDEQRFLQISQQKPALGNSLNRIEVLPTSRYETLRIAESRAISMEYTAKCLFTYQALTEAYRLSNRYINDVAQPRATLQLLENSVQQAIDRIVAPQSISATLEKNLGVKIGGDLMYGDRQAEKDKLLNLESLIHQRMINQSSAVKAVASALRRARAGVRNENRPIGTFLFLGPTGVGKTELAKSIADVYFGGEEHLIRIDLNEYVRADDVARLIADGATDAMSLSAQVQKNPFSVILLDEIEKAHPNVLTTLLQVLDEGILRDINNREISFRDAIIIATSNAGADLIRQYIETGQQIEQFSQQIQDQLIRSHQFRPEFLNRFDEIAIFRPLTKDELIQVIDLILAGINKNLALQKVFVAVDDAAKQVLVEAGYDPRLGARPMRRVVQRSVENIVAEKLLQGQLVPGSGIRLTADDIRSSLG